MHLWGDGLLETKRQKAAVARRFGVSRSFVKNLLCHEAATGSLASKPAMDKPARYLNAVARP